MTDFSNRLFHSVSGHLRNLSNPVPFQEKHGVAGRLRGTLKGKALLLARHFNLFWLQKPDRALDDLQYVFENLAAFEDLYGSLGDDRSRDALIEALNLRILGPYYVKARANTQDYWDRCRDLERNGIREKKTAHGKGLPLCHHFVFPGRTREIGCHASTFGIGTTFFLEQYAYRSEETCIAAEEGDTVLDGGGFLGETALYFADRVAPSGKVFAFEFNQDALPILRKNLDINPELASRTDVVTQALWHRSGDGLKYVARGPSTQVCSQPSGTDASDGMAEVSTTSIDDFVEQRELTRFDFLKFDIEGAEMNALRGAAGTLRRFRPKLAIALYHRIEDFLQIPDYIRSMDLGYRFYVKHAYVDDTETILFAVVP